MWRFKTFAYTNYYFSAALPVFICVVKRKSRINFTTFGEYSKHVEGTSLFNIARAIRIFFFFFLWRRYMKYQRGNKWRKLWCKVWWSSPRKRVEEAPTKKKRNNKWKIKTVTVRCNVESLVKSFIRIEDDPL